MFTIKYKISLSSKLNGQTTKLTALILMLVIVSESQYLINRLFTF